MSPLLNIKVADNTHLKATFQGEVVLIVTSNEGIKVNLWFLCMLYVNGLQTCLFSIESLTPDGSSSALYSNGRDELIFGGNMSISIDLSRISPTSHMNQAQLASFSVQVDKSIAKPPSINSRNNPTTPKVWSTILKYRKEPKRKMDVNLAHCIFGHIFMSSLMNASKYEVMFFMEIPDVTHVKVW